MVRRMDLQGRRSSASIGPVEPLGRPCHDQRLLGIYAGLRTMHLNVAISHFSRECRLVNGLHRRPEKLFPTLESILDLAAIFRWWSRTMVQRLFP